MAKKTAPLPPATEHLLQQFGERLRLARLRRSLSARQVCERAGMAPMTLRSLERGGSGVTIGAYLAVMQVLGIEQDIQLLGQADPVGRLLQDAQLSAPRAATMHATTVTEANDKAFMESARAGNRAATPGYAEMVRLAHGEKKADAAGADMADTDWQNDGQFISSDALAALIAPPDKDK